MSSAIPAVMFLGLSKGGFSSVGMVATPLVAIVMGPLEAAALLLPIILIRMLCRCGSIAAPGTPGTLK
jgi:hypothetical protein